MLATRAALSTVEKAKHVYNNLNIKSTNSLIQYNIYSFFLLKEKPKKDFD